MALLYETSADLKQLHQLKEAFRDIFESDHSRDQAALALADWMEKVQATGLKALDTFLNTLDNWGQQILNYFNRRTSQGFVEGYGYVYYTDPPEPSARRGPVPVLWFAGIFFLFGYKVWPIVIGNWLLNVDTVTVLFYLT